MLSNKYFLSVQFLMSYMTISQIHFLLHKIAVEASNVDYSYCRSYDDPSENDKPGHIDPWGRPLVFIGQTWSKKYYLMNKSFTADFFEAAFSTYARFGLELATIKTACEYGIVEKWFFSQNLTDYSVWIAGFRLGDSTQPPPSWITTGEPLDFSQFGIDAACIRGPYPPGGYSPIPYPWVNCLSVSRNCPLFTSGPTDPCEQSPTYPRELQFMWLDCRISVLRILCEETSYSKKGIVNENEIEI